MRSRYLGWERVPFYPASSSIWTVLLDCALWGSALEGKMFEAAHPGWRQKIPKTTQCCAGVIANAENANTTDWCHKHLDLILKPNWTWGVLVCHGHVHRSCNTSIKLESSFLVLFLYLAAQYCPLVGVGSWEGAGWVPVTAASGNIGIVTLREYLNNMVPVTCDMHCNVIGFARGNIHLKWR